MADKQNKYLAEHPKADQHKAWEKVSEKRSRMGLGAFVSVTAADRHIKIEVDEEYLTEIVELDGCYVLKTDLPVEAASTKRVHERYKDLSMVENAFRTMKTSHLKVRPVFLRNAERTRAHVLVVMLS